MRYLLILVRGAGDWRRESFDDRALMLAYELFCQTRDGYREEWREQKRKKEERAINPHEAMKRQMGWSDRLTN